MMHEPVSYEEYFRQIFGLSGSKKIVENIPRKYYLRNTVWEASYGSEIFFSGFDGGMRRRFDEVSPGEQMIKLRRNKFKLTRETPSAAVLLCTHSPRSTTSTQNIQQ